MDQQNAMSEDFQKYAVKHRGISSLALHQYTNSVNSSLYSGMPKALTPNIIEERQLNAVAMDVFSRLMMDRIIFLGYPIESQVANIVVAQLLYLESSDSRQDVSIYLNSPGGSVYDGLGIYDAMQYIKPEVATICTGMAASMGAVLLCAGAKGKRSALPHARVMIHQPLGGASGQATEIEIMHKEMQKIKKELYEIIARHTGQDYQKVWNDSERDYWMIADEAKEYGLIDEVLKLRR